MPNPSPAPNRPYRPMLPPARCPTESVLLTPSPHPKSQRKIELQEPVRHADYETSPKPNPGANLDIQLLSHAFICQQIARNDAVQNDKLPVLCSEFSTDVSKSDGTSLKSRNILQCGLQYVKVLTHPQQIINSHSLVKNSFPDPTQTHSTIR